MRITSPAAGVARLRIERAGDPTPVPPYALAPGYADESGSGGLLVAGDDRVFQVRRADGSVLLADARVQARAGHRGAAWELSLALAPGEGCFAWGEHALPLDRRGHALEEWNTDHVAYPVGGQPLYGTYPFLLGVRDGRAHGLLWSDPHRVRLDLTGERAVLRSDGGAFDLLVLEGPRPADVLHQHAAVTGLPPLWPRWALGLHQARWGWRTSARVREVVDGYRERGLPLSVIHLDIDHMRGFRSWTFDPERYGDGAELVAELQAQGVRVVTIVDPGLKVDHDWEPDREALARGLVVRMPDGEPFVGPVWPGPCHFPDFTLPACRTWWAGKIADWREHSGADGVWLDMNEPAVFRPKPAQIGDTLPDDALHDLDGTGGDHRSAHNAWGMLGAQATAEGLESTSRRPFALSRSGYTGIHRHAFSWTGDNVASWEHLRLALDMSCSFGLAGQPFVGADLGGFAGHPDAELYVRFLQAGVLLPMMRIHCAEGEPDREPWRFGEDVERIAGEVLGLRSALVPYLYALAEEASRTGAPLLRPPWWDEPGDARLRAAHGLYLLGDAILAAPALDQGARRVEAVLPAGRWREWDRPAVHAGGALLGAPLERLPLLVRCGSVLPTGPRGLRVDVDPAGGRLAGAWYEDDGETYAFREGAFRRVAARGHAAPRRLRLELGYEGGWSPGDERVEVELHGIEAPLGRVRVDGVEVAAELRGGVVRLAAGRPELIEIG
jgi:alpha-glucosidase